VTDANRHPFTAAEVRAYLDAVDRHRMPPLPDRPLPADLFAVVLTVNHRRPWSVEADEALETWHVSADVCDDADVADAHVGEMRFVAFDGYEPANVRELLAARAAVLPGSPT
jgi:hypothetical protein